MIRFINNFFIYIVLFSIIILLLEFVTSYYINYKADFDISSNIKYVVFGHSHSECAYNDSVIQNFKNFSESGEHYLFTYAKAKKILEKNPNIETVFIEFTNNQMLKKMDKWIFEKEFLTTKFTKYSPFFTYSDYSILATNNPAAFSNAVSLSFKERIERIWKSNYNYTEVFGGYLYLNRFKVDSLIKDGKQMKIDSELSESNLHYLTKTVDYCIMKGKKVILVRTPVHEKWQDFKVEGLYKEIIKTRFEKIDYIDFSKFPITNSEFGDLDHLNYKGAKKYSSWLGSVIDSLLEKSNSKQDYIDMEILKLKQQENLHLN